MTSQTSSTQGTELLPSLRLHRTLLSAATASPTPPISSRHPPPPAAHMQADSLKFVYYIKKAENGVEELHSKLHREYTGISRDCNTRLHFRSFGASAPFAKFALGDSAKMLQKNPGSLQMGLAVCCDSSCHVTYIICEITAAAVAAFVDFIRQEIPLAPTEADCTFGV
ncbi:uncharacterized protein BDZ99DRAFT_481421 [Mytilinidion resinicola]|uniref:Uncharacterized protein n=1 Tax=Mytilinidion resinicola TaxID=574789 RepID=A0A6A6Y6P0_9PEZI|nr:uncharacterized protein BDZ99DRAFT_481421 [Mytilinidion resinicola]KAF2804269.1 hypothetical protein BDZ99DRAFT_481421 [Mytilinidion resinicola]